MSVKNKNIYTILECEEDSAQDSEQDSEEDSEEESDWQCEGNLEKIEKKFDVFKIMKDYVKKY